VTYVTLNEKGIIVQANAAAALMFAGNSNFIVGRSFSTLIVPEDRDLYFSYLKRFALGAAPTSCGLRVLHRDDEALHVQMQATPKRDPRGRLSQWHVALVDISKLKRTEDALKRSEESLRLAVEGGNLATWDRDLISDKVMWNDAMYTLLGHDPDGPAIDGETFFEYIHDKDLSRVREKVAEAFKENGVFIDEFRIVRRDGEVRWLASHGRIYRDAAGRPIRMAGINYDVTERKRGEQLLEQYHEELEHKVVHRTAEIEAQYRELEELNQVVRQLSQKTIDAMENDRKALSKEIHDSIGGTLAAIKMQLEARLLDPSKQGLPTEVMSLEKIVAYLTDAIKETKRLSGQLRSLTLDDFGLGPALSEHFQQFKQFYPEIEIVSQIEIAGENIPSDIQTVLYRVIQEALNNAGKHSHATQVGIRLAARSNNILLQVTDDGCGFDVQKTLNGAQSLIGYGIHSMRERVEICNGTFDIQSAAGKGTRIDISIPL
jgi:PAS domain S-box-containing protein